MKLPLIHFLRRQRRLGGLPCLPIPQRRSIEATPPCLPVQRRVHAERRIERSAT